MNGVTTLRFALSVAAAASLLAPGRLFAAATLNISSPAAVVGGNRGTTPNRS